MSAPTTVTRTAVEDVLEFDLQGTIAGYWLVALRLVTGYWFLHAGWNKFAFVSGEAFDASGYLLSTTGSPIHGFLAWAATTPVADGRHERRDSRGSSSWDSD